MKHSKKYEKVKEYYDKGYWDIRKVHDAVTHGWITEKEFKEITDYDYEPTEE